MEKVKHPAKYSNELIPIFAKYLTGCQRVLDPLAGTGKLCAIREHGFTGLIFLNELEPEWAAQGVMNGGNVVSTCDARRLPYPSNFFDAICTSPVYGNRQSDAHNAKDGSKRITYTHLLGRKLSQGNTGNLQWGEKYRQAHREIWPECIRVLKPGGVFILNISDHIRKGKVAPVSQWHVDTLIEFGLVLESHEEVETRRMRFGANSHLRVSHENVFVFRKPHSK